MGCAQDDTGRELKVLLIWEILCLPCPGRIGYFQENYCQRLFFMASWYNTAT